MEGIFRHRNKNPAFFKSSLLTRRSNTHFSRGWFSIHLEKERFHGIRFILNLGRKNHAGSDLSSVEITVSDSGCRTSYSAAMSEGQTSSTPH
jgi:hypothetical protein